MGTLLSVLIVALGLGCVSPAFAAGDVGKGKVLFTVCASCHGADASGNQALNAPALKGLQGWYIVRQLKNFRAGLRGSDPRDTYGMQMRPMALTLADDQALEDVSAYIVSLSP